MPDTNLRVHTDRSITVPSSESSHATITNAGPELVYYKRSGSVSVSSNDGSIAVGGSLTIADGPRSLISTGVGAMAFVAYSSETSEDWHVVGDPGEIDFATGKENEDGTGADVPAWEHVANAPPAAFYKDPFGVVHLGGLALCTGVFRDDGSELVEMTVLTFPPGYRPAALTISNVSSYPVDLGRTPIGDFDLASGQIGFAIVDDGRFLPQSILSTGDAGTPSIIVLDGISFRAA